MTHMASSDHRPFLPGAFVWHREAAECKTWTGWVAFVCGGRSWKVQANGVGHPWEPRHVRRLVNFMLGRTEPELWPHCWTRGDYVASFGEVRVRWRTDLGPHGLWQATFSSDHHHFGGQAAEMLAAIENMLSAVDCHLRARGR